MKISILGGKGRALPSVLLSTDSNYRAVPEYY